MLAGVECCFLDPRRVGRRPPFDRRLRELWNLAGVEDRVNAPGLALSQPSVGQQQCPCGPTRPSRWRTIDLSVGEDRHRPLVQRTDLLGQNLALDTRQPVVAADGAETGLASRSRLIVRPREIRSALLGGDDFYLSARPGANA